MHKPSLIYYFVAGLVWWIILRFYGFDLTWIGSQTGVEISITESLSSLRPVDAHCAGSSTRVQYRDPVRFEYTDESTAETVRRRIAIFGPDAVFLRLTVAMDSAGQKYCNTIATIIRLCTSNTYLSRNWALGQTVACVDLQFVRPFVQMPFHLLVHGKAKCQGEGSRGSVHRTASLLPSTHLCNTSSYHVRLCSRSAKRNVRSFIHSFPVPIPVRLRQESPARISSVEQRKSRSLIEHTGTVIGTLVGV